ncbi:hypothetical protein PIB30_071197 [Stylosanthes scabra]|uniref:Uncharacterized protein n=1 Tax=Stylosanthes scabra TaxID=79078 RepID=A0ABU6QNR6_9FABA|nr:hypothetical protein [Stylosanthes scabra]
MNSGHGPLKMYHERYVSQEVNEETCEINFPASGNSGLSVVKGCLRYTCVVKYRHMMITWKPPIIKIEQALGCYVASSRKYVLRVICIDAFIVLRIQWFGILTCICSYAFQIQEFISSSSPNGYDLSGKPFRMKIAL